MHDARQKPFYRRLVRINAVHGNRLTRLIMIFHTIRSSVLTAALCAVLVPVCYSPVIAAENGSQTDFLPDEMLLDAIEQDVLSLVTPRSHARIRIGRDNAGNRQAGASMQLAVMDSLLVDIDATESRFSDRQPAYTTRSLAAGIGSARYSGLNAYIGFSIWGKTSTIETGDTLLELAYYHTRWFVAAQYQIGDITLYLDPMFASIRPNISSERDAIALRVGADNEGGRWWLSWLRRDYHRDLSRIGSSPLLQRIIQSIALDQAYVLSDEEFTAGYQWLWTQSDLRLELITTTSAIDELRTDYGVLWYRHHINATWSLAIGVQKSLQQNFATLNLGLDISW